MSLCYSCVQQPLNARFFLCGLVSEPVTQLGCNASVYVVRDGPGPDTLAEVEPVQRVVVYVYLTVLSGDGL